eukprot:6194188-Pleurochrysis_carterae.AAC.8
MQESAAKGPKQSSMNLLITHAQNMPASSRSRTKSIIWLRRLGLRTTTLGYPKQRFVTKSSCHAINSHLHPISVVFTRHVNRAERGVLTGAVTVAPSGGAFRQCAILYTVHESFELDEALEVGPSWASAPLSAAPSSVAPHCANHRFGPRHKRRLMGKSMRD